MTEFFYRKATVGPGYVIFGGDTEVDWKATREEAVARVDELEAKYSPEAMKAEHDALWRSVGLDPDNLPPPPTPEEQARRYQEQLEQGEQAAAQLARDYVAKHGTAAGLPPHLAKHVPEARLKAEREHPDIREVDLTDE